MIKKIYIITLALLCSCQQKKFEQKENTKIDSTSKEYNASVENIEVDSKKFITANWFKVFKTDTIIASEMYWKKIIEKDSLIKIFKADFINSPPLKDKMIIFLQEGKDHKSLINENYCKMISEPERAVLGYLTLLHGTLNYCYYNNAVNKEFTMRSAINLDNEDNINLDNKYPERFKSYLRFWFRNDSNSLEKINDDYSSTAIFFGQSVYDYFSKINLTVKGNTIYAKFNIKGFNRDIWESFRTEEIIFLVDKDNIKVIDKKELEEEFVYFYPNGSGIEPPSGYKNNGKGEYYLVNKRK
ncbi:hypothetical protein [Flavobacterium sp. SORGH_AS_0622]|jgi:hypothetical protein|uniref:hypothetical protein n=1 Tax=Flavobacterium sp. SORGH_AS_0622 TaxID=3041772 RepID=UPI00278B4FE5|nr:hypothetical protein [Flavobacterium sp. SORGH_AS_0622]MDQ1164330.1 hypothetical protein [Flavobacterium sp. SORGH_AS_0622]